MFKLSDKKIIQNFSRNILGKSWQFYDKIFHLSGPMKERFRRQKTEKGERENKSVYIHATMYNYYKLKIALCKLVIHWTYYGHRSENLILLPANNKGEDQHSLIMINAFVSRSL